MYGLLISLAILICVLIVERLANHKKLPGNLVWTGSPVIIVISVLGARAYHVLSALEYYQQHPTDILNISKGGLGIFGALIAGSICGVVFLKKHKQPLIQWMDVIAVTLPLGQAIGRWGNFFNRELYGKVTTSFLGISIDNTKLKYHPLFLYEAVLNIISFVILLMVFKKTDKPGLITCLYLISYGTIRVFLETLRLESWNINSINVAQSFSISFIIVGLAGLIKIKYDSRKEK